MPYMDLNCLYFCSSYVEDRLMWKYKNWLRVYFRPVYQLFKSAFLTIITQLLEIVQVVKIGHRQSKPCILAPVEGMTMVQT